MQETYDYVIVGAGTAGCVLASRLTADGKSRVLLLEAGGSDTNPWIHVPVGYYRNVFSETLTWGYESEPVPGLNGRRVSVPRGKVIGGSSSINGLVYLRGHRIDYDRWAAMGNPGWSYEDVLPYFKKSEDQERGADAYHGVGGPMRISNMRSFHPIYDLFAAAAVEAGQRLNLDFNGAEQDGVGSLQVTLSGRRRVSSATAYLRAARGRSNLRILTSSRADRLILEGRRAVGVAYTRHEQAHVARAGREVILAGGSINTPALLQLSGVGAPELLSSLGIKVMHALPGVGEGLQDHCSSRLSYRCRPMDTMNEVQHSLVRKIHAAVQYVLYAQGPLMTAAAPMGMFARIMPDAPAPQIQYQFFAGSSPIGLRGVLNDFPGFQTGCFPCRPESRGYVRIRSTRPDDKPQIQPNYLDAEQDRVLTVAGLRFGRKVFETSAMRSIGAVEELPGKDVQSDDELLDYVRRGAGTAFHMTSSCRMGDDALAVVDNRLRVHGLAALRIIDASIMPTVVSTNTNAATVMIAEKGSDMLLEDAGY